MQNLKKQCYTKIARISKLNKNKGVNLMVKKIVTIVVLYVIMQICLYPLRGNEWYYVMDALAYFASVYIFVQFNKKWRKSHFES
jgi:hypothetical protein